MTMVGVPSSQVAEVWPLVQPVLQPAIERCKGRETAETMLAALRAQDMQLWVATDDSGKIRSAGTTTVYATGTRKIAAISFGAGAMEDLTSTLPTIEAWAKHNGCDSVEIVGRPGWRRIFKQYAVAYEVIERKI